ncbi:MAG: hypothetical protein M1833_000811 [Piccolia ochrophora]|nr:MAG: hypothetical protein M1833_000811 [Piccolia ochrophora]
MSGTRTATLPPPVSILSSPTPSPLSLQYVAKEISENDGLVLALRGCRNASGLACNDACGNVNRIFQSPRYFMNCMAYPTLSLGFDEGSEEMVRFGIVFNDTSTIKKYRTAVTSCFKGYASYLPACVDPTASDCPLSACGDFLDADNPMTYPMSRYRYGTGMSVSDCINAFCDGVGETASVNVDVGGVGVYASYYMQTGIVLLGVVMLNFWQFGIARRIVKLFRKGFKRGQDPLSKSQQIKQPPPDQHKDRLIEALVDFQRAQCYFMMAIQTASIVGTKRGGLEAETLQEIYVNYKFLNILSVGGFAPSAFVLFELWMVDYKSWYMLFLTVWTMALSTATLFLAAGFPVVPDTLRPRNDIRYPNCGAISPVSYCLQAPNNSFIPRYIVTSSRFGFGLRAFAFCLVILIVIFLDQCGLRRMSLPARLGRWVWRKQWAYEHASDSKRPEDSRQQRLIRLLRIFGLQSPHDVTKVVLTCVRVAVWMAFQWILVSYLYFLTKNHTSRRSLADWGFGQIVAIVVWTPPVFQYLYLESHGMPGQRWNLPKGWIVARDKGVDENALSSSSSETTGDNPPPPSPRP